MALNTNIMNKTVNTFTLTIKNTVNVKKNILVLKRLKWTKKLCTGVTFVCLKLVSTN